MFRNPSAPKEAAKRGGAEWSKMQADNLLVRLGTNTDSFQILKLFFNSEHFQITKTSI